MATHFVKILSRLGWVSVPEPARSLFSWYQVPGTRYLDLPKANFFEDIPGEITGQEFIPGFRQFPGSGSGGAVQDLRSSCAGGQDDVSSQANSLKLFVLFMSCVY